MAANDSSRAELDEVLSFTGIDSHWVEMDGEGATWWPSPLPVHIRFEGPTAIGNQGFIGFRVKSPLVGGVNAPEDVLALLLSGCNERAALGACMLSGQADGVFVTQQSAVAVSLDHSPLPREASLRSVAAVLLTTAALAVPRASHIVEVVGGKYATGFQHPRQGLRRDEDPLIERLRSDDVAESAIAFDAGAVAYRAGSGGWQVTCADGLRVTARLAPGVVAVPDLAQPGTRRYALESVAEFGLGIEPDDDWGPSLVSRVTFTLAMSHEDCARIAWALNTARLSSAPSTVLGAWHAPFGTQGVITYVSRWPGGLVDERRAELMTVEATYEAGYAAAWLADQPTIKLGSLIS